MPYMRPFRGTFVECSDMANGAFPVGYPTLDAWERTCQAAGHGQPTNRHGLPLRPYPAGIYNGDAVDEGVFVDWQHDTTRQFVFTVRRQPVVDQRTHRNIAAVFGPFQHPLHPYRAADCWARRVDRAQARGRQPRDPQGADYRRWAVSRFTPEALAAASASPFRAFGIEVEFLNASARPGIERDLAAAGIPHHIRWGGWHREAGIPGWHCTYDSTVSGGEIISDIMDGSAASRDEVAAVLRIVRDNGGQPGTNQGMHVHHDVRDFTTAERVRLVDNIAACQTAMLAFVGGRRNSHWCRPMSAREFADVRSAVAAGRSGANDHGVAWNFGHVATNRGSIEFRALGNTLNGRKVRAWIQMGQAMLTATKAGHTFTPNTTVPGMLAILRDHGMSRWASDVFATRCGHSVPAAA